MKVVDTAMPTPNDFSHSGDHLQTLSHRVASRSVVVLLHLSYPAAAQLDGNLKTPSFTWCT
jgi:hypothetical protein